MPIPYPLSPPAIAGLGPQDFTLSEVNVAGETESPFTLQRQVQQWPGQRWEIEANLPPMLKQQAEQWISFLGALFGKVGFFNMGDYNRPTPQGPMTPASTGIVASGTTNVSNAQTLVLRGCAPSVINWAKAGDYISPKPLTTLVHLTIIQDPWRLFKILQDASTDSSGNVTLQIFPSIRETIADNTPIFTSNCIGSFALADNTTKWTVDRNGIYKIAFKAKEYL